MDMLDQIKTPQGRFPVKAARIEYEPCCSHPAFPQIVFDFVDPRELAASKERKRAATLEDIAFLDRESVLSVAALTGPLFGAAASELLLDWQNAANIAHAVALLQEAVNGMRPVFLLDASKRSEGFVAKTFVKNTLSGAAFKLYAVSFPMEQRQECGYAACLPEMPWFRKFRDADRFDYAFASLDEDQDGSSFLSVVLFSFDREISPLDFAAVLLYLHENNAAAVHDILSTIHGDTAFVQQEPSHGGSFDLIKAGKALKATEAALDQDDLGELARLVQAVVSLHVTGAKVDVFRSNDVDGFITFENYLSSLWYGFSRRLGKIKVGYCQQCGKPFSLASHRGIPKRFCSEACKTAAKNKRQRDLQEKVRRSFLEGMSVKEVARASYPKDARSVAAEKVRASLRQWVELRHRVERELAEDTDALAVRCLQEGVYAAEDVKRFRKRAARKAGHVE